MEELALKAVLPAALVAGVVLAVAWRSWPLPARAPSAAGTAGPSGTAGEPGSVWPRAWAVAAALGLGYFAGHVGSDVMPPWPPREAGHRLAWMALAGAFVMPALWKLPGLVRWPVLAAVAVGAPTWLLSTLTKSWSAGEIAASSASLGLGTLALTVGLERLAARRPGATVPLAVMLTASLASGALIFATNATQALFFAALAAVSGAAWVNGLLSREALPSIAGGAAALLGLLLALLATGGFHLSYHLPATAAVLLGLAPLGAWLGELRPRHRLAWALAGVLVPAGAALCLAWQAAPPPSPYGY